MRFTRNTLLPFVVFLAACGTTPDYTVPTAGPGARLRLATSFAMAEVFKMDSPECVSDKYALIAVLGDMFGNENPGQSLGIPLSAVGLSAGKSTRGELKELGRVQQNAVTEVRVAADQVLGLRMFSTLHFKNRFRTCEARFAFQPRSGQDYEAVFHTAPWGCRLALSRIVSQPGREAFRVNEPFKRVEARCNS